MELDLATYGGNGWPVWRAGREDPVAAYTTEDEAAAAAREIMDSDPAEFCVWWYREREYGLDNEPQFLSRDGLPWDPYADDHDVVPLHIGWGWVRFSSSQHLNNFNGRTYNWRSDAPLGAWMFLALLAVYLGEWIELTWPTTEHRPWIWDFVYRREEFA